MTQAGGLSHLFAPFPREEIWVLERFVRKVDELNASAFARTETNLTGRLISGASYLGGPAIHMELDGPSEEAVKAVAGDFRQLYTDKNPSSAMRVMKLLQASANRRDSEGAREAIEAIRELRRRSARRRRHDPRGAYLEEDESGMLVERTPEQIVSIWLNGEYLHDDRESADELDPPGHASTEMMRMSLQMTIRDFLVSWTALRDLVVVVLADQGAGPGGPTG